MMITCTIDFIVFLLLLLFVFCFSLGHPWHSGVDRAVIVGESSTFGKGTVQQPMDIGRQLPLFAVKDKAGYLKVTIQKFYRPSGSSTQMEGVVPNIVMPSIMDALEVGEAHMENALPHDRIRPAADFRPEEKRSLFIPRLKELSQERISKCQDFNYSIQDILKMRFY